MMQARKDALEAKNKFYVGTHCRHGHPGVRYTSTSECFLCKREGPKSKKLDDVPKFMDTLGARIARTRMQMSVSQSKLATDVKVTQAYLSRIENDRQVPTIWVVAEIAKVLDVSIDFLCCFTDNNEVKV